MCSYLDTYACGPLKPGAGHAVPIVKGGTVSRNCCSGSPCLAHSRLHTVCRCCPCQLTPRSTPLGALHQRSTTCHASSTAHGETTCNSLLTSLGDMRPATAQCNGCTRAIWRHCSFPTRSCMREPVAMHRQPLPCERKDTVVCVGWLSDSASGRARTLHCS